MPIKKEHLSVFENSMDSWIPKERASKKRTNNHDIAPAPKKKIDGGIHNTRPSVVKVYHNTRRRSTAALEGVCSSSLKLNNVQSTGKTLSKMIGEPKSTLKTPVNVAEKPPIVKPVLLNLVRVSKQEVQKKLGPQIIVQPFVTLTTPDGQIYKQHTIIKENNKDLNYQTSNRPGNDSFDDSDYFKGFDNIDDDDQTLRKIKCVYRGLVQQISTELNDSKNSYSSAISVAHPVVASRAYDGKVNKEQDVLKEPNKVAVNMEFSNSSESDSSDFEGFDVVSGEDLIVQTITYLHSGLLQQRKSKLGKVENSFQNEDQSVRRSGRLYSRVVQQENSNLKYVKNSSLTRKTTQTEHYFVKDEVYECRYCAGEELSISSIQRHLQSCFLAPLVVVKSKLVLENSPTMNDDIQPKKTLDASISPSKVLKLDSNFKRGKMLELGSKYGRKRHAKDLKIAKKFANYFYNTSHSSETSFAELEKQPSIQSARRSGRLYSRLVQQGNSNLNCVKNSSKAENSSTRKTAQTEHYFMKDEVYKCRYCAGEELSISSIQMHLQSCFLAPLAVIKSKLDVLENSPTMNDDIQPEKPLDASFSPFKVLKLNSNLIRGKMLELGSKYGGKRRAKDLKIAKKFASHFYKTSHSSETSFPELDKQPSLEVTKICDNETDSDHLEIGNIRIIDKLPVEQCEKNNNHSKTDTSNSKANRIGILQPVTSTEYKARCPHCSEIICGFNNYSKHLLKHRLVPVNVDSTFHPPEFEISNQNKKSIAQNSNQRSNWKKAILKNYLDVGNECSVSSSGYSSSVVETCEVLPDEHQNETYVTKQGNDSCKLKSYSNPNQNSTKADEKLVSEVAPSVVDLNSRHSNCQLKTPKPFKNDAVMELKKNPSASSDNLSDDVQVQGVLCALCHEIFENERLLVSHLYRFHLDLTKPSIKRDRDRAAGNKNSNAQIMNHVVSTSKSPKKNAVVRNNNCLQAKEENVSTQRASLPSTIESSDVITSSYSKNKKVLEKENNLKPVVIVNRLSNSQLISTNNHQSVTAIKGKTNKSNIETKKDRRVDNEITVMPAESTSSVSPHPTESCNQCQQSFVSSLELENHKCLKNIQNEISESLLAQKTTIHRCSTSGGKLAEQPLSPMNPEISLIYFENHAVLRKSLQMKTDPKSCRSQQNVVNSISSDVSGICVPCGLKFKKLEEIVRHKNIVHGQLTNC